MQTFSIDRIRDECDAQGIIIDDREGYTQLTPSVIIIHGVKVDKGLHTLGMGRQHRFLVLLGSRITIEHYENQIAI